MLLIMKRFSEVNISQIRAVYDQTIKNMAEDLFAQDLRDFFLIPGGRLFVLDIDGAAVSALRAEPYLDGVLFSWLETKPDQRGRGYGNMLVAAALKHLKEQGIRCVYSHIGKNNAASIAVHRANGFSMSADYAKLLDGTVSRNYYTFQYNSTAE